MKETRRQRLRYNSVGDNRRAERRTIEAQGQEGMAILTVMLLIMVVLILGSALALTAHASLDRARANTDSTKALNIAEAGLQSAAKTIIANKFAAGQTGTLAGTLAGGGDYEVSWTAPTAMPWFEITATGFYPSKTDFRGRRRISAQVSSLNAWDFQYADAMGGAKKINGNTTVYGPVYVNNGSLELDGHAAIVDGPLMIRKGNLTLTGSASVGTAGASAPLYLDGTFIGGPSHASPIYNSVPVIEFSAMPAIENYRFDKAPSSWLNSLERPCAVWDTNDSTDWTVPLDFSVKKKGNYVLPDSAALLFGSSRVSWELATDGTPLIKFNNDGEVQEDGTVKPVKPILFIDGDLKIDKAYYQGIGTIVAREITVNTSFAPEGFTETNMAGFPGTNALGLVATYSVTYSGQNGDFLAAAVYSATGTTTFSFQGSLMGNSVVHALDLGLQVPELHGLPGFSLSLPPRLPGGDQRKISIVGWTELSPQ